MEKKEIIDELYKARRKNFPTRPYTLTGVSDLFQTDLADLTRLASENDGKRYILVLINCFTKFVSAIAIPDKKGKTVAEAMAKLIPKMRYKIRLLSSDAGGEYLNSHFKDLMRKSGIHHYVMRSTAKAAFAEAVIKTLKRNIFKTIAYRGDPRYIDILQNIIDNYNATVHSKTKMKPKDVRKSHEKLLLETVFKIQRPKTKPKFKVSDIVRISRKPSAFDKVYDANWSLRHYEITNVNAKKPATFKIRDYYTKEPIIGSFYEQELSKVKNADVFLIDHVLEKRKGKVKVSWLGYPGEDSWLEEKDFVENYQNV